MPARRLFIAVDISEEARRRAAEHIDKMREFAKNVRVSWERPEKLHITLKFLGNVEDERLEEISDAVATIADRSSPFEMFITGTGVFPRPKQPRVLWLGVEDQDRCLTEIASQLDSRLSRLGFEKGKHSFSPHLTMARIREPQKAKGLAGVHLQSPFEPEKVIVKELAVYQSELRPSGSLYSLISGHALKES